MKQTILAVVLELQPQAVQQAKLGARAFANVRPRLSEIETLHFMSITVFDQEQHYDPLLLIEANFDGEARFFWAELIAQAGQELMDVVRYCKMDRVDRKEATPTTPITPADLPAFLERHTVLPSASHRGNRGLSRNRILAEAELYRKTQEIIDTPDPHGDKSSLLALRQGNARKLHRALRKYPGLVIPPADPARRDAFERVGDWLPVILIVLAILAAGFLAAAPWSILGDGGRGIRYFIDGLLFAGLIVLTVSLLLLAILVPVLRRVRRLELTDPVQDWPHTPENRLQALLDAEADCGGGYKTVQNHLASMVLVKPGILRAMIISIGMTLLNRIVRINAVDGYLGSMRTIHFAHWVLVGNRSRLLFFSNFDGSWESYLDDFVEKAHTGLTFAWSNCVGFPPTTYLLGEGATHGREFKAWARHSQRESLFWYSAYRFFTVDQIERHAAFANGLRESNLSDKEMALWATLL